MSRLPREVLSHAEWPLKKKKQGPVAVLPRTVVQKLRLGPWYNSRLYIDTGAQIFAVIVGGLFGRRNLRRFFAEHGWALEN